jgi:hypothetical protein
VANPSKLSYQLAAAVANGIALSQAVVAAGPLNLNGSLVTAGVAQLDVAGSGGAPSVARRVLIASSGADSAIIFTIVGTDRNGNALTGTVTGVASGTSQFSAQDFATVTSVSANAATAGNITVGTNGVGSGPWVMDNWMAPSWMLAVACLGPAGTIYTVEHTYDDFNQTSPNAPYGFSLEAASTVPATVWPNPVIANVTGTAEARYDDWPIFGHRLTINSGTGLVTMWTIQAGIGSP